MDQSLDGGLKPKNTNSWGTKNIINPWFNQIDHKIRIQKLQNNNFQLVKK